MAFIEEVINEIANRHSNTNEYVLILPSRRAKRFVLSALSQTLSKPVFSPTLLTFGEFIEANLPGDKAETTQQLIILYEAAQNIESLQGLSFDEFIPWAEVLLHDFSELSHQRVPVKQAFDNVLKIKQLESWNLESEYSPQQKIELEFWEHIPALYEAFVDILTKQNKTTSALKSLKFSEEVLERVDLSKHYYFLGFNALSKAEIKTIHALIKANKASIFFEISQAHFENQHHEAGYFIRKNASLLPIETPRFIKQKSETIQHPIEVVECVQASSQVKVISTELDKLSTEERAKTAVILADENLLIPLLKSIPKSVKKANITVGLSLLQTPVKAFMDRVFSIQENKKRLNNSRLYHKDLWGVLRNPLVRSLITEEEQVTLGPWETEAIRNNVVFHDIKHLPIKGPVKQLLTILTEDWNGDFRRGVKHILACVNSMLSYLPDAADFERQQLESLTEGLQEFLMRFPISPPIMSLSTFRRLFQNHWGKCAIGYHGNPTQGLQIMGLLESRMLSFERVFILGMNEGNLPKTNPIDSHLPMDLRRALELPTPREKQGLFAHHFYRLLYDAEHVFLTYKSSTDGFGGSEKSRYISQLSTENPPERIRLRYYFSGQLGNLQNKAHSIQKNNDIQVLLERYFSGNVSASAFLTYLKCPLNFYYKYIIGLGEDDAIEEEVDMGSVGTLVHKVLEELYDPYAQNDKFGNRKTEQNPLLTEKQIITLMSKAPKLTKDHFVAFLNGDHERVAQGKNWLTLKMATKLVLNALQEDLKTVQKHQKPIEIIQLETPMKAEMPIMTQGQDRTIHWIGYVDRIDKIGEVYRIIDYKTGIVKDEDVTFTVKDDLLKAFSTPKHALQLLVYRFLFQKKFGFFPDSSMIYALPTQSSVQKKLSSDSIANEKQMELLTEFVTLIFEELFNTSSPIEHNNDSLYCTFC
jgi:RecB family exonuclease